MSLAPASIAVLLAYLAAITAFGAWLGRRPRSVRDYFLGGRRVPWWAVAACVVATETSTLTFIGAPGAAYAGNWTFLQLVLGYVVGRVAVSLVLLPAYFRGDLFTSYELLQRRFGRAVRSLAAGAFLAYRTLADGIRLHAAALVLSIASGGAHWEWVWILLIGTAMIVYTEEGGVTATIWTDVAQMGIYLLGALVCLATVTRQLPGGVTGALAAASAAGKLQVVDLRLDLREPYTLLAGLVGGAFLTLATHGTDHYLVQRLLVARSERDARTGLILSGVLVLVQFVLFLLLGTLLWVYYEGRVFARADEVLPTFIASALPGGLTGLILAAVLAAALSPSLNSMASATLRDFYLPYLSPQADEAHQLRLARAFTVFWGVAQMAVAFLARGVDSALQEGLAALGYASGPTVGAFLLAVLVPSVGSRATLIGMTTGLAATLLTGRFGPLGADALAWTWSVALGASVTVLVGLLAGRFRPSGQ